MRKLKLGFFCINFIIRFGQLESTDAKNPIFNQAGIFNITDPCAGNGRTSSTLYRAVNKYDAVFNSYDIRLGRWFYVGLYNTNSCGHARTITSDTTPVFTIYYYWKCTIGRCLFLFSK